MKSNTKLSLILLAASLALSPHPAEARLQDELNNLADRLGAMSTTSSPGVFEGQTRGYLTAGSMSLRFPQETLNFASTRLPKIRAGCEGIDFDLGAFSYINRDQLVAKLRMIGSNSLGYATLIGLESVSPQIAGTIKYWESELNKRLGSNLSTCQAARALVDGGLGLVERIRSSQINRCAGARVASGASPDYDAAREECANNPGAAESGGDEEDREMGRQDHNYLWDALGGLSSLSADQREMILSLVGTVITKEGATSTLQPILTVDELMAGGDVDLWSCPATDPNCLDPVRITNPATMGMTELVGQRMKNILTTMQAKSSLAPEEIAFVSNAPVPLYRMMNALSTLSPGVADSYIAQWAEPISFVLVHHWITQTADQARQSLTTAKIGSDIYRQLNQMISAAEQRVRDSAERTRFTMATFDTFVQTLERLEKAISQNLTRTGLGATYDFGKVHAGK